MRVLAFDTCLDACSVAVLAAGRVHARVEPMHQGHAERLFPMIETVLSEAGLRLAEVDTLAVTLGPGTFTGTRIGLAAARGIALATGARIRCATSLSLLAATAKPKLPPDQKVRPIAVCLDARKGEVMLEICRPQAGPGLGRPQLATPAEAAAAILADAPDAILIGTASALVAEAAATALTAALQLVAAEPEARYLPGLASTEMATPAPLYLRAPDAKPQPDKSLARSQPRTP